MGRPRVLHVGEVELDLRTRELRRAGASVAVQPRVFDVLVHLVEHRDRVVTKSELLDAVWPGETVVPDVLTTALHGLRRALGDDPKAPAYVRTVHRVGYQLIAPVTAVTDHDFPALETRHAAFVGRRAETSLFEEMLAGLSSIQLLFVHGPPGIGKTTLLHSLGYLCRKADTEHVWLAGETAGPFPDSFVRALATALGCEPSFDRLRERLAASPIVVFVDDVHLLDGVDEWMRQQLWPALPARARLVLAGRRAPSAGDALARVTRGHPLALALAADLGPGERHLHLLDRLRRGRRLGSHRDGVGPPSSARPRGDRRPASLRRVSPLAAHDADRRLGLEPVHGHRARDPRRHVARTRRDRLERHSQSCWVHTPSTGVQIPQLSLQQT